MDSASHFVIIFARNGSPTVAIGTKLERAGLLPLIYFPNKTWNLLFASAQARLSRLFFNRATGREATPRIPRKIEGMRFSYTFTFLLQTSRES